MRRKSKFDCEICGGQGTIKLARRFPASFAAHLSPAFNQEVRHDTTKTFPCPECADVTDHARVSIIGASVDVDERYASDAQCREFIEEDLANHIAHELRKGGFLRFASAEPSDRFMKKSFRATLGVVSQNDVATIEQRALAKMKEFFGSVAAQAEANISHWGSHYTGDSGPIRKADAIRFMNEAFAKHMKSIEGGDNGI
ncbi:hypothetical protein [Agrobacterium vitis]|uniref:hypothetical protein n=1 Tax=Agrobacterium vitis TaxID=373 RepID=UPI000873121C|nr:hypothetical protein [Agrobacterium vitis]MCM2451925.1 hypothetical protein [Agrobacterium vitis]MCM2471129.1 hypothetical protein [Agrobacterium vitis]MUO70122.1 hypothetical protein [Agrobacterium vitis]